MPAHPAADASSFVPEGADLDALKEAARGCKGCHLYENATQTVFGRGRSDARLVLVGEQPGDVEDQRGLPFVGPAGLLLRRAVGDADIDVSQLYITNAVKHFKFERAARGPRRIHRTPDREEILACRPWLIAEFAQLRPVGVVALGATAAQALLGSEFRVTRSRGKLMPWPDAAHRPEDFGGRTRPPVRLVSRRAPVPSSWPRCIRRPILRADDREQAYAGFVADLTIAAKALTTRGGAPH